MGSDVSYSDEAEQLHVLAVDDSLVDRKVIERLLKISGCKVTAVESGSKALQYLGLAGETDSADFNDLKVNLIMTDYSMPGMTGFELLQKIKGSRKLREIPMVIMSSENISARVDRCLEEGAEDFLVKPVKLTDVERLKNLVLRGEVKNASEDSPKRKMRDDSSPLVGPLSTLMAPTSLLMAPMSPLMAPTPPLMAETFLLIDPTSPLMGPMSPVTASMTPLMASSPPLIAPSPPLMVHSSPVTAHSSSPTSSLVGPMSSLMAPSTASPSPLGCDSSMSPMSVAMAHERQPKCARLMVAAD